MKKSERYKSSYQSQLIFSDLLNQGLAIDINKTKIFEFSERSRRTTGYYGTAPSSFQFDTSKPFYLDNAFYKKTTSGFTSKRCDLDDSYKPKFTISRSSSFHYPHPKSFKFIENKSINSSKDINDPILPHIISFEHLYKTDSVSSNSFKLFDIILPYTFKSIIFLNTFESPFFINSRSFDTMGSQHFCRSKYRNNTTNLIFESSDFAMRSPPFNISTKFQEKHFNYLTKSIKSEKNSKKTQRKHFPSYFQTRSFDESTISMILQCNDNNLKRRIIQQSLGGFLDGDDISGLYKNELDKLFIFHIKSIIYAAISIKRISNILKSSSMEFFYVFLVFCTISTKSFNDCVIRNQNYSDDLKIGLETYIELEILALKLLNYQIKVDKKSIIDILIDSFKT